MHWFWRVLIAMIVSFAANMLASLILARLLAVSEFGALRVQLPLALFRIGVPIAVYALLTFRFGPRIHDNETHCRKCDYILRGLTEPRCPECGERI